MKISKIEIKNFRSIENIEFEPKESTVICGPNSSGKSNIFRAIRLAFIKEIDSNKLSENFSNNASASAKCKISIEFSECTTSIAKIFGIKKDETFNYKIEFRKTGRITRSINGELIDNDKFIEFCESILIIYVPAIRDISTEGLAPFKISLIESLKKKKGTSSLQNINRDARKIITSKGQSLLSAPNLIAKDWLGVKALSVDASQIDILDLISSTSVNFSFNSRFLSIEKLGTGHQSAVILKLYRELGNSVEKPVIYLFEEPDNHLHPTSINLIARELKACSEIENSQVFLTTHSPYMLNQFELDRVLSLNMSTNRITGINKSKIKRTSRQIRIALGKFGLKPAEAMVSKKVIIVEGANDATVVRSFINLYSGTEPESLDILITPAGGKSSVSELAALLEELSINWCAVYDWDGLFDTNIPILRQNLTPEEKNQAIENIERTISFLNSSEEKKSKTHKILESSISKINDQKYVSEFKKSSIGNLLKANNKLTNKINTDLEECIRKKYFTKVNKNLNKFNIFVWSNDIERVVAPESAIEDSLEFLRQHKNIKETNDLEQKRKIVYSTIKNLAFEAELLSDLINHLWGKGHYKQKEAVRASSFFLN